MSGPTPKERLAGLIEFAKHTARLKTTPPLTVAQHKDFHRFEDRIKGLPGVTFNVAEDEFDEIWLRVERLHESRPPVPDSRLLAVWISLSNSPSTEPALKHQVERQELVELGALAAEPMNPEGAEGGTRVEPAPEFVAFTDFPDKLSVETQLNTYTQVTWRAWAEKEKEVRKSIAFYADLFTVAQKLQGNLVDSQLELAWGLGIGVWALPKGTLTYPVLTQLVEVSLNEKTMALEVRPRSSPPRLEADVYAAMDNPGVSKLAQAAKEFFVGNGHVLNPFEPSTFEAVLKSAASLLDAQGTYWPTVTTADDRTLPKAAEQLAITDTWVLFARPRSSSIFIQDLERFEKLLEESVELEEVSPAALALVTDPSTEEENVELPAYRGLSNIDGAAGRAGKAADLFFPMSYNDEQVQIVQMLEAYDGVVVQGPPGTGKTHTIANVISHYLAQGKRVLVTSMKDPALAVLQEKLPEPIQPLAISLLTSEADGMRQFEFAINKISAEVTRIDKAAYRRQVAELDGRIDGLHGHISKVDADIAIWARRNLDAVALDDETLTPLEIAQEVTARRDDVNWFPDAITVSPTHRAKFSNDDIVALRKARAALKEDLRYLINPAIK